MIAGIKLRVSVDGQRIDNGQFFLRGVLNEEKITVQTAKLWAKANKEVTMTLKIPAGEKFNFMSGTLASEYMDMSELDFSYSNSTGELDRAA